MQNILVFLVEVHLKLVLGYFYKIGHCNVDFCNIYIKLCWISMEIEVTLKQEIIELVRLNATKGISDTGFSSPWISIKTRGLISIKSIGKSTKYSLVLLLW